MSPILALLVVLAIQGAVSFYREARGTAKRRFAVTVVLYLCVFVDMLILGKLLGI